VAPGGNPDADRFRPLRSGGSTSSLTNALLIVPSFPSDLLDSRSASNLKEIPNS
jgi:hypothetical protein